MSRIADPGRAGFDHRRWLAARFKAQRRCVTVRRRVSSPPVPHKIYQGPAGHAALTGGWSSTQPPPPTTTLSAIRATVARPSGHPEPEGGCGSEPDPADNSMLVAHGTIRSTALELVLGVPAQVVRRTCARVPAHVGAPAAVPVAPAGVKVTVVPRPVDKDSDGAEAVRTQVDLGHPGDGTAPLIQTCRIVKNPRSPDRRAGALVLDRSPHPWETRVPLPPLRYSWRLGDRPTHGSRIALA
jgi:hypothetical protein